jgi:hypothetical protein
MSTDYRALCAELVTELALLDYPPHHLVARALEALAEPQPSADGEVGELVAWLGVISQQFRLADLNDEAVQTDRAADLLERLAEAQVIEPKERTLLVPKAQPIPVSERLPEANTKVLAHYFNALGKGRTICAIWVPAKSCSEDCDFPDDDFTEYDEEDDKFYWPEGWYEAIENWDDLGWVKVNGGEIAYWQPLPKWPAQALPLPSGEVEE